MKPFKEFVIESFQQQRSASIAKGIRSKEDEIKIAQHEQPFYFQYKYQGWQFIPTVHQAAQAFDRCPKMDEDKWKDFHQKVFDKLKTLKPIDGEFIFFSKKYQQAYVAAVDFQKKTVRIITVLPPGRSNPKPGTVRMIIEGQIVELERIIID